MERKIKSAYKKEMTLVQQLIYIQLVMATFDKSNLTNIKPATIADRLDLCEKTVTKAISSLIEMEMIEEVTINGSVWYHIIDPSHFEFFTQSLIGSVSNNAAMIALRMASCRVPYSPSIKMLDKDILERISVSKMTYTAAKKELLASNILIKTKGGYLLDTTFFPVVMATISEENRGRAAMLIKVANSEGFCSAARVFKYYYERNFEGLRMSPDDLIVYCEAGCPGIKHNKVTDTYEIPETYEF